MIGGKTFGRAVMFMLSAVFTIAVLLALYPQRIRANEPAAHVAAVAIARAEIITGVRISNDHHPATDDIAPRRPRVSPELPRPRERSCPEEHGRGCRMIVVDMP